jgi:hypothetical protein
MEASLHKQVILKDGVSANVPHLAATSKALRNCPATVVGYALVRS